MELSAARTFQAEGTARAKVLGEERSQRAAAVARSEIGEKRSRGHMVWALWATVRDLTFTLNGMEPLTGFEERHVMHDMACVSKVPGDQLGGVIVVRA